MNKRKGTSVAGFYIAACLVVTVAFAGGCVTGWLAAPRATDSAYIRGQRDAAFEELSRVNERTTEVMTIAAEVASADVGAVLATDTTEAGE